jgi:WhiB family transcriptional regulator, redox-sensing transcriptional regulator
MTVTLLTLAVGERRLEWVAEARCRTADPDELFVTGAAQRRATLICRECAVVADCLADALDNRIEFGVWGGMTERQRRKLIRAHPEIESWSEFIASRRSLR